MSTTVLAPSPIGETAARHEPSVLTLRRRVHDGTQSAAGEHKRFEVQVIDNEDGVVIRVVLLHDGSIVGLDELEAAACKTAAEAPPVSEEQRGRLRFLLGGGRR